MVGGAVAGKVARVSQVFSAPRNAQMPCNINFLFPRLCLRLFSCGRAICVRRCALLPSLLPLPLLLF